MGNPNGVDNRCGTSHIFGLGDSMTKVHGNLFFLDSDIRHYWFNQGEEGMSKSLSISNNYYMNNVPA